MINTITKKMMETIATYMNDEIRESVHNNLAPCTPVEFMRKYLELDTEFSTLLKDEFSTDDDLLELAELTADQLCELEGMELTEEEFSLLMENPNVERCENNGFSGFRSGKMWFTAYLTDNTDFDYYM